MMGRALNSLSSIIRRGRRRFAARHFSKLSRQATFVILLPILSVLGLIVFKPLSHPVVVEDDLAGRLHVSGHLLASYSLAEWFGLRESTGPTMDAGCAHLFTYAGVPVGIGLWLPFCTFAGLNATARQLRGTLARYISLSLSVGATMFSIKTAALLWFLYGSMMRRT